LTNPLDATLSRRVLVLRISVATQLTSKTIMCIPSQKIKFKSPGSGVWM
jgi:hypothetical protein